MCTGACNRRRTHGGGGGGPLEKKCFDEYGRKEGWGVNIYFDTSVPLEIFSLGGARDIIVFTCFIQLPKKNGVFASSVYIYISHWHCGHPC